MIVIGHDGIGREVYYYNRHKLGGGEQKKAVMDNKDHNVFHCFWPHYYKVPNDISSSNKGFNYGISIKQFAVQSPCRGRFWNWPTFSQLCRCTILRCSTALFWG